MARPDIATLFALLSAAAWIYPGPSAAVTPDRATLDRGGPPSSRMALSRALPAMDGEHLKVSVVEVEYGPGGHSTPHRHPCPVVGYVIRGSLRMKVQGQPETLYRAGETFYEPPGGLHAVSANASDQEPARFVAFFVCDRETPLSVAEPAKPAPGGPRP